MAVRSDVLLLVGTTKGLFVIDQAGVRSPIAPGLNVSAVAFDRRTRRILASVTDPVWGTGVRSSDDMGRTWAELSVPNLQFPADTEATLLKAWQLHPAGSDQMDVIYAGVEPAALFRSQDGGKTFELMRGLWDHPHRPGWLPGGGGICLHTILIDPRDSLKMLVAISVGGVYCSDDGGQTWRPSTSGVRAYWLPQDQPYPDHGQCVHKVVRDAVDADTLYMQNHYGLYRSDDSAASWTDIADGVPSDFGFAMVGHPRTGSTVWIIPHNSEEQRWTAGDRCRVYRTRNGGDSWEPLSHGLPQTNAYITVLRDAFCSDLLDPAGLYFGTRGGEVYGSSDEGETWQLLADHLPTVLCVGSAML